MLRRKNDFKRVSFDSVKFLKTITTRGTYLCDFMFLKMVFIYFEVYTDIVEKRWTPWKYTTISNSLNRRGAVFDPKFTFRFSVVVPLRPVYNSGTIMINN